MTEYTNPIPTSDPDNADYKAFLLEKNKSMGKEPLDTRKMIMSLNPVLGSHLIDARPSSF